MRGPKTTKKSMLKRMCSTLPCRNIAVNRVSHAGAGDGGGS